MSLWGECPKRGLSRIDKPGELKENVCRRSVFPHFTRGVGVLDDMFCAFHPGRRDVIVFAPRSGGTLFRLFPAQGLLACYSIEDKRFFPLPGADDPHYIQTCPAWSPDGKYIVFSRAKVEKRLIDVLDGKNYINVGSEVRIKDLNKKYQIKYNLYRVPFNNGRGGVPEPVAGASHNGRSNYFPRFSPDGRWIVFTQCETGLAIQPSSKLYIIPAEGGTARRMHCNTNIMNSWHSWSPNSRWLVFSSKINTPYTELFITHIDKHGYDSTPVLLSRFSGNKLACIAPEFVDLKPSAIQEIQLATD